MRGGEPLLLPSPHPPGKLLHQNGHLPEEGLLQHAAHVLVEARQALDRLGLPVSPETRQVLHQLGQVKGSQYSLYVSGISDGI